MFRMDSARLRGAALGALALALLATPAAAAMKLGPNFPLPNNLNVTGMARDGLLGLHQTWLENGLDNIKKARAAAASDAEKTKALDEEEKSANEDLAVIKDKDGNQDVQRERKRLLLLAVNQWINELNRQATQQMKIAIMSDGAEAMAAQNRNFQLSSKADELEHLKHDASMENWGK